MTRIHRIIPALLLLFLALPSASSIAGIEETKRVESATEVLSKIMEIPESAIPPALLADAQGIAIIPGVIKVGLFVGGQYGRGVLVVRGPGGAWSNPVFITLMSGSIGWQIGAESTDFVIVFKTPRSIEGIMKGQYTLGAEAAAAAGPVGRSVKASTDIELKAEIYSYSRSRGLFAGVSLEGSSLQVDDKSNAAYYEKEEVRPSGILSGKEVKPPAGAEKLKITLEKIAPAAAK
ncbi:lipid-binding SYLF domain-containing protein [Candidatus Deferrimicrobium sp.]|uniref:lipid-binding SYLF domain-containing protein n=1 Tax=Candidatus Deferrimicrobium sp. TaxID=3060586 RepID=UPI003C40F271